MEVQSGGTSFVEGVIADIYGITKRVWKTRDAIAFWVWYMEEYKKDGYILWKVPHSRVERRGKLIFGDIVSVRIFY